MNQIIPNYNEVFECPYCQVSIPINKFTLHSTNFAFHSTVRGGYTVENNDSSELELAFIRCPHCKKHTLLIDGIGEDIKHIHSVILPASLAKQFPEYVPPQIRQDYEEAYSIARLSPKASATLSRRCLQGIIRDFWGINDTSLYKEIDKLKSLISPQLWKVIDSIRQIGNIGAHMESDVNLIVDIEPHEAMTLLKLIERLIKDWYIDRYEQEQLYNEILQINKTKQDQRKGN